MRDRPPGPTLWPFAIQGPAHDHHLPLVENTVTCNADKIINPGRMATALSKPVLWMEPGEAHKIIDLLRV